MNIALTIAAALLAAPLAAAQTHPPPAQTPPKPTNNSCVECHEPEYQLMMKSVHTMVACAACHGGDIRVRKSLTQDEKKAKAHSVDAADPFVAKPEAKCTRCHKNETEAWNRGAHGLPMKSRGNVACKDCHAKDPVAPSDHTIRHFSFEKGGLPGHPSTGIDTTFVHRIGLFDERKKLVDAKSSEPYSPAATCGKCHDYATLSKGRHFAAGRPGAEDGRPGEPWILWDAATQTQIPVSYRAWPGVRTPAEAGLTDWDFALRFGAHHPGGGPMEWLKDGKKRTSMEEPSPDGKGNASRWKAAGAHAVDCLACHLATPYNREERSHLVRAGLFRFAPEAAAGISAVKPALKKTTADGDEVYEPLTPDKVKPAAPGEGTVAALRDASRFDAEGRVLLDITRHPPARNCEACHATRVPGTEAPSSAHDRDVHLAAGFGCTDCHRNGIDHEITRGDGGDLDRKHNPENATLSCRGCHASGRQGAPAIPHRGLPAFHLEKIACTTCHSGPVPDDELQAVQTARAHGLGLIACDDLDGRTLPAVRGPVFRSDGHGQIRPHYAIWPAYWGEKKDGKVVPLPLARVKEAADEVKKAGGDPQALLAKLKEKGVAEPVRVAGGRVYRLEGTATVSAEAPEAQPCFWPIGHSVRPAQQALGAKNCSDCHALGSPFFFGKTAAVPAGPDGQAVSLSMNRHLGLSTWGIALGALAVMGREFGMTFISVMMVLGLLGASLGHMVAGTRVARLLGVPEVRATGAPPDLGLPLRWVHFCCWGLVLALIVTGTGFLMTYGPTPLPNIFSSRHGVRIHVVAGLTFAALVPLLALGWIVVGVARKRGADWVNAWGGFLWMARGRGEGKLLGWDRLWIWIDLLCALAVAATGIVLAMRVPAVGNLAGAALRSLPDNHVLGPLSYTIHGMAGAALIGRLAMHLYSVLFLRKRG
jgi:hypothetical protein